MHFCVILILVYDVTLIACLAESWTDEKQQAGQEELGRQFQQCLNCTLKVSAIAGQKVLAVSQLYTEGICGRIRISQKQWQRSSLLVGGLEH